MSALQPQTQPPLTPFEQDLDAEAKAVYGQKSGTVWRKTARLLETELGLQKGDAGAISVTEESTLNNRLVSPGLVRSTPKVIVVFSGIGTQAVEDRLDEFIPLTRHLTTVAIADRATAKSPWRVRRIVEVSGVGVAHTDPAALPGCHGQERAPDTHHSRDQPAGAGRPDNRGPSKASEGLQGIS